MKGGSCNWIYTAGDRRESASIRLSSSAHTMRDRRHLAHTPTTWLDSKLGAYEMTYEQDEHARQQDATEAMIAMRQPTNTPAMNRAAIAATEIQRRLLRLERFQEALEEIACRHVTQGPLWWQQVARDVLDAQQREQ